MKLGRGYCRYAIGDAVRWNGRRGRIIGFATDKAWIADGGGTGPFAGMLVAIEFEDGDTEEAPEREVELLDPKRIADAAEYDAYCQRRGIR